MVAHPIARRVMTLMQVAMLATASASLYAARADLHRIDDVCEHVDRIRDVRDTLHV